MYFYKGIFAGIPVSVAFHEQNTALFYENWLYSENVNDNSISVPAEHTKSWQKQWKTDNRAYSEYILSCSYICDYLMRYNRVVFHGAAFLWKGKAYLFSAPSGTGKTTQIRHWEDLFKEEVKILNGDKPILEIRESSVYVHPSPWKGKEGIGRDDIVAPLGGIIFLRQDQSNSIRRLDPKESSGLLFGRSYSTFSTEREVVLNAMILEKILKTVPVWLLSNKGDTDSAMSTHQALMEEL